MKFEDGRYEGDFSGSHSASADSFVPRVIKVLATGEFRGQLSQKK